MRGLVELKKKHAALFCLAVTVIDWVVMLLLVSGFKYLVRGIRTGSNIDYLCQEMVYLLGSSLLVLVFGCKHIYKMDVRALLKSQWSGAVFYVILIIGTIVSISDEAEVQGKFKSPVEIVAFVIFVMLVGLAEESVFRGVIAGSLFDSFGNTVKGTIGSVLFAGLLFGGSHFGNILSGQSVQETVVQVVGTTMLGILLSAIYYKHRSLYGVALLHALLDFAALFTEGFYVGHSIADVAGTDYDFWANLIRAVKSQSVYIIVAVIILRPSVIRRLIAKRN